MVFCMRRIPIAITIAGSDSGGGAGIQADLKTFAALGVHGTVALTSVTAQNTYEVRAIHDIPPHVVYEQIIAIAIDMGIDAGKTGMLSNAEIIETVARAVDDIGFPLVVDPVMIAKSGAKLLRDDAIDTLIKKLLPLAKIVTPNAPEASRISGVEVKDLDSAKKAAKKIVDETGVEAAIVKGGHLTSSTAVDVMYWNNQFYTFESERVLDGCTHGTGCSFSAAIAAELAKGANVYDAVREAKKFITTAISYGLKIGRGHCPVNPMAWLYIPAYKHMVIEELERAICVLMDSSKKIIEYMPEVGMNIVMSLPPEYTRSINDVAGVKGRIIKYGETLLRTGPVEFGVSKHLARLVIELQRIYPEIRSALNIKYDEKIIDKARVKGYKVVFIDRRMEPDDIRRIEGATMKWIANEVSKITTSPPDIIYDIGDIGREAMIRIIGRNALEVVNKLLNIIED